MSCKIKQTSNPAKTNNWGSFWHFQVSSFWHFIHLAASLNAEMATRAFPILCIFRRLRNFRRFSILILKWKDIKGQLLLTMYPGFSFNLKKRKNQFLWKMYPPASFSPPCPFFKPIMLQSSSFRDQLWLHKVTICERPAVILFDETFLKRRVMKSLKDRKWHGSVLFLFCWIYLSFF